MTIGHFLKGQDNANGNDNSNVCHFVKMELRNQITFK